MKNPNPLEKAIEAAVIAYAKSKSVLVYKFTSPNQRHVPDRLFIHGGKVWFIEFKRKGEKPTRAQEIEHGKMMKAGAWIYVVDNIADGRTIVDFVTGGEK